MKTSIEQAQYEIEFYGNTGIPHRTDLRVIDDKSIQKALAEIELVFPTHKPFRVSPKTGFAEFTIYDSGTDHEVAGG